MKDLKDYLLRLIDGNEAENGLDIDDEAKQELPDDDRQHCEMIARARNFIKNTIRD